MRSDNIVSDHTDSHWTRVSIMISMGDQKCVSQCEQEQSEMSAALTDLESSDTRRPVLSDSSGLGLDCVEVLIIDWWGGGGGPGAGH